MRIVVSGSIAYDYLMTFPGRFTDQIIPEKLSRLSVSFLVDDMVRKRGGTAANIAYSLKLLGGEPILLGTVGQDFGDYETWLQASGIRTDHVVEIPHKFTASFFVSTDEEAKSDRKLLCRGDERLPRHFTGGSRVDRRRCGDHQSQ